LIGGGAALAAAAFAPRLLAQTSAVTRIIFPFGAGGGGDSLSRVLTEQLAALLGRSFIVENRTGAFLLSMRSLILPFQGSHALCRSARQTRE
jgi:tripartite-type tricarboxylate transporter receptor subunit TctC